MFATIDERMLIPWLCCKATSDFEKLGTFIRVPPRMTFKSLLVIDRMTGTIERARVESYWFPAGDVSVYKWGTLKSKWPAKYDARNCKCSVVKYRWPTISQDFVRAACQRITLINFPLIVPSIVYPTIRATINRLFSELIFQTVPKFGR